MSFRLSSQGLDLASNDGYGTDDSFGRLSAINSEEEDNENQDPNIIA